MYYIYAQVANLRQLPQICELAAVFCTKSRKRDTTLHGLSSATLVKLNCSCIAQLAVQNYLAYHCGIIK